MAKISIVIICLMILAAILFFSVGTLLGEKDPAVNLAINEVMSSNRTVLAREGQGTPDWIEIFNYADQEMNLKGFSLTDDLDTHSRFVFSDTVLPAGGYLIVYATGKANAGDLDCTDFSISKEGETLWLIDPSDNIVQKLEIPALGEDISYARKADGSFGYCISPTPDAENKTMIGDLTAFAALAAKAKLQISEILPNPDSGAAWIELVNAGAEDLQLGLFYLTDDLDDPYQWRFPSNTLHAGEYVVIYASEGDAPDNAIRASFNLSSRDKGVYLHDIAGNMTDDMQWDPDLDKNFCVVASYVYTMSATPGRENAGTTFSFQSQAAMDSSDPVRINEVLIQNKYSITDRDGDREQWVELYNSSSETVRLSGYYLSDDPDDLFKWAFPDIGMEPGCFKLVFLSGKTSTYAQLHASFKISDLESALYLTRQNGMRVDKIAFPDEYPDNISFGRDASGDLLYYPQPTPLSANTAGFAKLTDMSAARQNGVFISEVCAANEALSSASDWIELFNGGQTAVDLSGWYLSDDKDLQAKWRIKSMVLEPGQYTVLEEKHFLDAADAFGISLTGEQLFLNTGEGLLVDTFETGVLRSGVTSGRVTNDASWQRCFFASPTKGKVNTAATASGYAAAPVFSQTGLYCQDPFTLAISCSTPGAQIYYTLDGTEPTRKSILYLEPILIGENAALTAVAFADGLLASEKSVATYLFDDPHTVPVFCLTGNPKDIQQVFVKSGRMYKPEYAVNVEYYEADGRLGVSFPAGVTPKGRASLDYSQKSVTIKLRGAYGRAEVNYPFFADSTISTYSELTLRNGGQDIVSARMRDSFFQMLSRNLRVDSIETHLAVLYVNGEYWGLYDLDEEQEEGYFQAYYGADEAEIDLVNRNDTARMGDTAEYLKIRRYARTWRLADDAVFADFAKLVDVDACTDYLIANIFFGNGDMINQRFWHTRDYSVRWRPLLFDLDWCMRFNDEDRNMISRYFQPEGAMAGNNTITNMDIFCGLKKNAAWRESFISRCLEIAYSDYDTSHVLALFDETVSRMEPEMARHVERWDLPASFSQWKRDTAKLRAALSERREIVLQQLRRYFNLSRNDFAARILVYTS
jgi:hypothetical protein